MSDLLTIDELAAFLRTTSSTIYDMRSQGRGPRSIRGLGRILYRQADVDSWLEERTESPRSA